MRTIVNRCYLYRQNLFDILYLLIEIFVYLLANHLHLNLLLFNYLYNNLLLHNFYYIMHFFDMVGLELLVYFLFMGILLYIIEYFILFYLKNYHLCILYDNLYNFVHELIITFLLLHSHYFYPPKLHIMVIVSNILIFYIFYYIDNIMLINSQYFMDEGSFNRNNIINLFVIKFFI